jgi:hypothetical protein
VLFVPQWALTGEYPRAGNSEMMKPVGDVGVYLELQLLGYPKMSALQRGNIIEGHLSQDVYAGDRKTLPAGSRVRLTVSGLRRHRKERSPYWPWIVRTFAPSHENYPIFDSARITLPDREEISLRVSLISMGRTTRVYPRKLRSEGTSTRRHGAEDAKRHKRGRRRLTVILKAVYPVSLGDAASHPTLPEFSRGGSMTSSGGHYGSSDAIAPPQCVEKFPG